MITSITAKKLAAAGSSDIFGTIEEPPGVSSYNAAAGGNIGLIIFVSRLIRVITVVGGLFVLVNVILAGFTYISSMGDTSAHEKVRNQIMFSVIGLLLIVGSYAFAGIIGLIFFGDATFILDPKICGPAGC